MPRPAQPFRARGATSRRSRAIVPTLIVLAVLAILYGVATALWTERLWFASVDFTSVFTRKLLTETGLFLVFALLMGAVGGLPPAIRAARANVAHTLRAL